MKKKILAVNDFVILFANTNGSGSASANEVFARSIMRMGVPVSPRNFFPSNIQGMPTWYEVRVSEAGFLGRRGGYDMVVAMNPQSWNDDVNGIEPGGYLFYDSTRRVTISRNDINVIGMPLTEICSKAYASDGHHLLFKNVVYVGALAALLNIESEEIEKLFREKYKSREKLLDSNVRALYLGYNYARENFNPEILGLSIRRSDRVGDRILIDGNSACALGAVYGGASVCAWYPITPSTSVPEMFQEYCMKYRRDPETGKNNYAIIQAEDELASIGMAIGAGWNGARSFTATSGPGVSLMTEFLGLAYFAEVPVTIVNVQRGGPSTGMPSHTQQSDILSCAYASHGDTKHVLLIPEDPKECFDFTAIALDLADHLQTPVFVLSDTDIGMNARPSLPFVWDDSKKMDRGKVMTREQLEGGRDFGRYLDVDGDGVPYRTYPGTHPSRGAYFTRGTTKDRYARYTEEGPAYVDNMERLKKKFDLAKKMVPCPVIKKSPEPTGVGVIYYGSTSPAMAEALAALEDQKIHVDALRLRGFPFDSSVIDFIKEHEQVYVVEQNRDAQMRSLLIIEGKLDSARLIPIVHYDGTPITARFITKAIREQLSGREASGIEKTLLQAAR